MKCNWMECEAAATRFFLLGAGEFFSTRAKWMTLPVCNAHADAVLLGRPDDCELEELSEAATATAEVMGDGLVRVTSIAQSGHFIYLSEDFIRSLAHIRFV